jgi:hypothetical protein
MEISAGIETKAAMVQSSVFKHQNQTKAKLHQGE